MEYKLCEFLKRTPSEIGEIRRERPADIAFIERMMLHEAEEREKARKKAEREAKKKSGKHKRR